MSQIKITQPHPMTLFVEVPVASSMDVTRILFASDLHIDNRHTRLDLLKKDLDRAKTENRMVFLFGDIFCAMQARHDPRRNKTALRDKQLKTESYTDSIVDDAADFLEPYAGIIFLMSIGNHESSVLKNSNTDLLKRLADKLKDRTGFNIFLGGYQGWVIFILKYSTKVSLTFKVYYNHGSGGDAEVTVGAIEHQRMSVNIEGADAVIMGHNHNQYHLVTQVHYLEPNGGGYRTWGEPKLRTVHNIRTPSYKQEYIDSGFHIERRGRPKPLGCALLDLRLLHVSANGPSGRSNAWKLDPVIMNITHNEVEILDYERTAEHKTTEATRSFNDRGVTLPKRKAVVPVSKGSKRGKKKIS